jgi:uncharacterized membrane protein YgcG
MSDHRPPDGHPVLRGLALWAVAAGVVVLAAAAFVLSYPGIHAVALHAGVSRSLARIYPVIFDAMLVIACAAVLSLRGAGLVSRCYAWLSLLVLLAAAAGADTLHSTGTRLPHRQAAAAAAIIPWALLLIGFGLLLAMLRHARLRRIAAARAAEQARAEPPQVESPVIQPHVAEPTRPAPTTAALPPGTAPTAPPVDVATATPGPSSPDSGSADSANPISGSARSGSASSGSPDSGNPISDNSKGSGSGSTSGSASTSSSTSGPTSTSGSGSGDADRGLSDRQLVPGHAEVDEVILAAPPVEQFVPQPRAEEPSGTEQPVQTAPFHRMWSTPTPPDEDDEG